jgi:hypothetical protein
VCFADETKAGALGKVAFENRPCVHVPERARAFAAELVNGLGQLFQTVSEYVVIVRKAGVSSDFAVKRET